MTKFSRLVSTRAILRSSALASLLASTVLCGSVMAQSEAPEPAESEVEQDATTSEGSAVDLKVPARAGVGYTSEGAGFEGVGHIEGFFPISQEVGEDITFIEARLLLDHGIHLGSNFLIGHRAYDEGDNRNYAGYVGFDMRSTDKNLFPQVNLGVESLGDVWDFRVNGYLPINRRRLVTDRVIGSGTPTTSTGFEGNLFILEQVIPQQRVRLFEGALPGVDGEIGVKLAQWDRGNLRAFAGGYFYDGLGRTDALGWRLRLAAQPTENFSLGVSVQDDALFGLNVVGTINARLPGLRPRKTKLDKYQRVAARLRDPFERTKSVTLDTQRIVTDASETISAPLMNPEEERNYIFQHVTLGATGGDGTFESPFGTVQEALDSTIGDGNDIVYVNGAANVDIPAFTIPSRVRVLSRGPVQRIAGIPFPGFPRGNVRLPFAPRNNFDDGILVDLPFSGDGNFPVITGGGDDLVTLSDRTVLAGFQIQDAPGNGIVGENATSIELRNNIITNSGERGIFLDNIGSSAILFDNIVTGSQGTAPDSGQGLFIRNTTSENALTATINGFQFDDNAGAGIELLSEGDGGSSPNQVANIAPSTPDNTSTGTSGNVIITNTVSGNGGDGISATAITGGSQEVTIQDITISENGGNGIEALSGDFNGTTLAAQEVFIQNNQIENNALDGILAETNAIGAQELAINNNTISNNGGAGIRAISRDIGFQEFVTDPAVASEGISNNIISGNGEQAIIFNSFDLATQVADVNSNTVTGNNGGAAGPDLVVTANDTTTSVCIVPQGNTIPAGIELNTTTIFIPGAPPIQAFFQVGDRDNVSANNNGAPVSLINLDTGAEDPSVFEDFPLTTCFP